MICTKCGKSVNDPRARFCAFCGGPLQTQGAPEQQPASSQDGARSVNMPTAEMLLIPARCSRSRQPYLLRMRRRGPREWVVIGALPVEERRLRNPDFQSFQAKGGLKISGEYPGCPYCKEAKLFFDGRCGGRISCCPKDSSSTVCPWCGEPTEMQPLKSATVKGLTDN